jgi:hypothetical protein
LTLGLISAYFIQKQTELHIVKFLLSWFIFVLAVPVAAQTPARRAPAPPAKPLLAAQHFSSDMEKLPVGFRDNDFESIYKILSAHPLTKPKGEFESTAAYQNRAAAAEKIALGSGYTVADDLYFLYLPRQDTLDFSVVYDADKEMFDIDIRPETSLYDIPKTPNSSGQNYVGFPTRRSEEVAGCSFMGRTILGVSFRVRKYTVTERFFAFDNFRSIDLEGADEEMLTFKIRRSPSEASLIKPYLGFLLVARLKPPFVGASSWTTTPKLDDPKAVTRKAQYLTGVIKELWLINMKTGEIYKKVRFNKQPAPTATDPEPSPASILQAARKAFDEGRYEEAKHILEALLETDQSAQAYLLLGKVQRKTGNLYDATVSLKNAILSKESPIEAYIELSRTYGEMRDCAGATVYIEKALEIDPKNPDAIAQAEAAKNCRY